MKLRIISGVAGVLLLIAVLTVGSPLIEFVVSLLATVAVYEILNVTGIKKFKPLFLTATVFALCITLVQAVDKFLLYPLLYVFVVVMFVMFMINRQTLNFKDVATTFMVVTYVSFMFSHLIYLCSMENGIALICFVCVSAFLTDTFAMFSGKFFGKHKLCPLLSPKKTVEGSIGGVVGCMLSVLAYCYVCETVFALQPNYINALIIGFFASIISQIGDLSASCIKRQYDIKDYGKIMPGHGGVMDRFDSILFVAPLVYYAIMLMPIFG